MAKDREEGKMERDVGEICASTPAVILVRLVEEGLAHSDAVEIPFGEDLLARNSFIIDCRGLYGEGLYETLSRPQVGGSGDIKYNYSVVVHRRDR